LVGGGWWLIVVAQNVFVYLGIQVGDAVMVTVVTTTVHALLPS